MNKEVNKFISKEAEEEFNRIKEGFAAFKDIDFVMPNDIEIKNGALPPISEEQASKNIMDAMERLYGSEDTKDGESKE